MENEAPNTSFPKKEKLCGKTAISKLLAQGRHGNVPGMRYLFLKETGCDNVRFMVSVPKKIFKRAVKRNLYKRRIRESWRKQKHLLAVNEGLDILIMYATKELLSYEDIYSGIGLIIEKVNKSLNRGNENEGNLE